MREDIIQEEQQIAEERNQVATPFEQQVLKQRIRDLPDLHPAVTIVPHAPVQDVIRTMAQEHIDGVLVVEHDQIVGVCTARDIVARLAEPPTALDQLAVRDCMRPRPECLKPDTEIAYALHHMHIHHDQLVPLVDEHEQPAGVVTLRDIIGHLVSLFPQEILNLPSSPEDMLPSKPEGA